MQHSVTARRSVGRLLRFIVPCAMFLVVSFAPAPAAAGQCAQRYPLPTECHDRVKCEVCATPPERYFITNPKCACEGDCDLSDFVGLTIEASRYLFGITGSLALLMFAVGGFWWLTAAGASDRIEKGKKTLVAAVIGILIVFGAWVIVNALLAALTGNVTQGVAQVLNGNWNQALPGSPANLCTPPTP